MENNKSEIINSSEEIIDDNNEEIIDDNNEEIMIDDENIINEEQIRTDIEEKEAINKELAELNSMKDKAKESLKQIKEEKKKKVSGTTTAEILDLQSEFGAFLGKLSDITPDTKDIVIIPTGIKVLDAFLGGGFAVGSFTMLVGSPGCGKSMLAGGVLGSTQKVFDNTLTAYLDSEETVTKIRLLNLGVNNPQLDPYTDITVEKVFKFIEGLCVFKSEKKINTPSAIVWDSIANTLTIRERETDDINKTIGYKARLLSVLLPKYISKMRKHNISIIAVNQLRDKIDMGLFSAPKQLRFMSSGKSIPGGNSLIHNSFTVLEMAMKELVYQEARQNASAAKIWGFDGFITNVNAIKNKLFVPNIKCSLVASFNYGFSDFWTSFKFLIDVKKIKTSSWCHLIAKPDLKFRAKEAEIFYKTKPEFKEIFDVEIENAIKIHITEKYSPENI